MKKQQRIAWTTLFFLVCTCAPGWAAPGDRGDRPHPDRRPPSKEWRRHKDYHFDKRHHHNRYYPPPGRFIDMLPHGHRRIPFRGHTYFFYDGIWYRPSAGHFTVIVPPVGLFVPALPPYYTTIWVRGYPYYYAGGVYYVWRPEAQSYMVTELPSDSDVVEQQPPPPEQLFVYPKEGQNEEQQATDRYECHRWAVEQTGFDPTRPGGNVPAELNDAKRAEYQRAMKACLEARGYSVQ